MTHPIRHGARLRLDPPHSALWPAVAVVAFLASVSLGGASAIHNAVVPRVSLATVATGSGSGGLPSVLETLFLDNGTTASGNVQPLTGYGPSGIAYDPATKEFYVAESGTANVLAISASSHRLLGSVNVGAQPVALALDPATGDLYVSDQNGEQVAVVDPSTLLVVAMIPLNCNNDALAYDAANGNLYVAGSGCHAVVAISGSSNKVVASISTDGPGGSSTPDQVAVDPANDRVFVGGWSLGPIGGAAIDVIDGGTNQVVGNITLPRPSTTTALAFDPSNGYLYDGEDDGYVNIISASTDRLVTSLPTGTVATGVAFDPSNALVFLPNPKSGNLTVINASTNQLVGSIPVAGHPNSLQFDPVSGLAFVVDGQHDSIELFDPATASISGAIPMGVGPDQLLYDPAIGKLLVHSQGVTGTTLVDPNTLQMGPVVPLEADLSEGAYDPVSHALYLPQSAANDVLVVNATTLAVESTVSDGNGPYQALYDPTNGNVYVAIAPPGCTNLNTVSVLDGRTGQAIGNISIPTPDPGGAPEALDTATGQLYVGNANGVDAVDPAKAQVVANATVGFGPTAIDYDPVTGALYVLVDNSPPYTYVDVMSDRTNTVTATIPVSMMPQWLAVDSAGGWGYVSSAYGDQITVFDPGTNAIVENLTVGWRPNVMALDPSAGLAFAANMFSGTLSVIGLASGSGGGSGGGGGPGGEVPISFVETGLPTGTGWSVSLAGATHASTTSRASFAGAPGAELPYTIAAPPGYGASPVSGTLTVPASAVTEPITFAPLGAGAPPAAAPGPLGGAPSLLPWALASVAVGGLLGAGLLLARWNAHRPGHPGR